MRAALLKRGAKPIDTILQVIRALEALSSIARLLLELLERWNRRKHIAEDERQKQGLGCHRVLKVSPLHRPRQFHERRAPLVLLRLHPKLCCGTHKSKRTQLRSAEKRLQKASIVCRGRETPKPRLCKTGCAPQQHHAPYSPNTARISLCSTTRTSSKRSPSNV